MSKLTIVRGVSGSGKSTWARSQPNVVVVSRDDLRVLLFGSDGPDYYAVDKAVLRDRENYITKIENTMIETTLAAGKNVISDNTHIEWKYVVQTAAIAQKVGAEVEIKTFDVSMLKAQANNVLRAAGGGRKVPNEVIQKQHERLQGTKNKTAADLPAPFVPVPYEAPEDPYAAPAVLVDIDGTLAHMRDYRGPFDWHKVGLDDVDEVIADLVNHLEGDHLIVVMSGRDESCRDETVAWLNKHGIEFDMLYMRPEKDMRKDNIVKDELFEKHIAGRYDVKFVLDDRQQVVDMWRAKGLTCLQVAPGDF